MLYNTYTTLKCSSIMPVPNSGGAAGPRCVKLQCRTWEQGALDMPSPLLVVVRRRVLVTMVIVIIVLLMVTRIIIVTMVIEKK